MAAYKNVGMISLLLLALVVVAVVYVSFYISSDIWSGKYGMYEKVSGCSFHPRYGAVSKEIKVPAEINTKNIQTEPNEIRYLPEGVFPGEAGYTNEPIVTSQVTNLFNDPNKGSVAITNDNGTLYGDSGDYEGVYTYVKIRGQWYFISTIIFGDGGVTQSIYVKVE